MLQILFPESDIVVCQPVIFKSLDVFDREQNIVVAEICLFGSQLQEEKEDGQSDASFRGGGGLCDLQQRAKRSARVHVARDANKTEATRTESPKWRAIRRNGILLFFSLV